MYVLAWQDDDGNLLAVNIPEGREDSINEHISKHTGIKVKGQLISDDEIVGILKKEDYQNLKATLVPRRKTWDEYHAEVKESDWYKKSKSTRLKGQASKAMQQIRKAQGR